MDVLLLRFDRCVHWHSAGCFAGPNSVLQTLGVVNVVRHRTAGEALQKHIIRLAAMKMTESGVSIQNLVDHGFDASRVCSVMLNQELMNLDELAILMEVLDFDLVLV